MKLGQGNEYKKGGNPPLDEKVDKRSKIYKNIETLIKTVKSGKGQ